MTIAKDKQPEGDIPPSLIAVQVGVWRILLERSSSYRISLLPEVAKWKETIVEAHIPRFIADVYRLAPGLVIVFVFFQVWSGVEQALLLHLSSKLLHSIEASFATGHPDSREICTTLAVRLLFLSLASALQWLMTYLEPVLQTRVKMYFKHKIMQSRLNLDLATSQDKSSKSTAQPEHTWFAFRELLCSVDLIFSVLSQLLFITSFTKSQEGGLGFALLCFAKPIVTAMSAKEMWNQPFVVHAIDVFYRRTLALYELATDDRYQQEIISGTLKSYIASEFEKAQAALGDTTDEHAMVLYSRPSNPFTAIGLDLLGELPLAYFALKSIFSPGSFSIASLAMLQQTSLSLEQTFRQIRYRKGSLLENLSHVKALYAGFGLEVAAQSEVIPYPPQEGKESEGGMAVELCDVSFGYPGKTEQLAVKNVSFKLKSSDLVVIVGTNGSGKSSLVKLISGLYNPTSGVVTVDDHNLTDYRDTDLGESIALLAQNHNLFPLSISENIGIGNPSDAMNDKMIWEAAKLGGAYDFIVKSPGGFSEVLAPVKTSYSSQYPMRVEPLKEMLDKIERSSEVSGGEQQRLVASRTFMRILSDKIKLVIVDEPSSAMDPEGEFQLFERLRQMRAGKTMVFVTHRFGHLTKHADLILCMKDGELVESGTHRDLIQKDGEYAKLYNIQAQAFAEVKPVPLIPNGTVPRFTE